MPRHCWFGQVTCPSVTEGEIDVASAAGPRGPAWSLLHDVVDDDLGRWIPVAFRRRRPHTIVAIEGSPVRLRSQHGRRGRPTCAWSWPAPRVPTKFGAVGDPSARRYRRSSWLLGKRQGNEATLHALRSWPSPLATYPSHSPPARQLHGAFAINMGSLQLAHPAVGYCGGLEHRRLPPGPP